MQVNVIELPGKNNLFDDPRLSVRGESHKTTQPFTLQTARHIQATPFPQRLVLEFFVVDAMQRHNVKRLIAVTEAAGMEALVEVHDEAEVDLAIAAGAGLIGVNNRNLATLEVDIGLSLLIAERIPDPVVRIAESGLRTRADLESMRRVGYAGFLIGETLVRAADPGSALRELIG